MVQMTLIIVSGHFLSHAFRLTNNPEYLDESIAAHHGITKISHAYWIQFEAILGLIDSLYFRFMLSKDRKDFDEMMQLFPIIATNTYMNIT